MTSPFKNFFLRLATIALLVVSIEARTLKIFVVTGETNALGQLGATGSSMSRGGVGSHPAEQSGGVPFFWDNRADDSPAGDAALGDSGGQWTDLEAQDGGFFPDNANHWGPEIGFCRLLWQAGYRDFGIVKVTGGSAGNGAWTKGAADDFFYQDLITTVNSAVSGLPGPFTDYEIAGLVYLQGESNDATEADLADLRFSELLLNLQNDLGEASPIKGIIGAIGGGSTAERDLTRSRLSSLAASRADIGYASNAGLVQHDGLHYDADSQLLLGERMAAEAITLGCFSQTPLPAWPDLAAWFVSDNGAQPDASGQIQRWANLSNGSGSGDLTRTVSGRPDRQRVSVDSQLRRVMSFDGSSDLWASSGEFGPLDGPRSVAVLCRLTGNANGYLFDGSTFSGRTRAQIRDGSWQAGVSTNDWDQADSATAALSLDTWQRHLFVFDEAAGETVVSHWIDGILVSTHTDPADTGLRGLIIGSNGGSPFRHLSMEIAEVAVYGKALDNAETDALDSDWQDRWGNISGPPFGITVTQNSSQVPRFGWHPLMRISVDLPTAGTRLTQVVATLKPGSFEAVEGVRLVSGDSPLGGGSLILGEIQPGGDTVTFDLDEGLAEGSVDLWLTVAADRWGTLGQTIDATLDSITFSGDNAGTLGPVDPPGQLELALVPLVSDVRRSGDFGVNTYRIPGIACDDQGVLHAVFDHRWNSSGDLPGDIDVGYARSEDGGATWSGFQTILDFDENEAGSQGNGVGDPAILWDPVTDTLWASALWSFGNNGYFGSGPGLTPAETGQYVLTKSEDGGVSWSAPINVTTDVKIDPNWRILFPGPGHGLAMRDGTLVFPSQYRDASGTVRLCSVYSDDHGANWQFGSGLPDTSPQTNENTVCELDDGRLLFSARTPVGSNGQRAWAYYTPGGTAPLEDGTWSDIFRLASVPDPVCQGSVVQWTSTFRGDPREHIAHVNPGTSSGRVNLTLRASADAGGTWPVSRLLYDGPSAYSSVCVLPDRSLGILFEKDNYTRMTFMRVEEDWLWNPDVDSDSDGMPDNWEILHGTDPGIDDASLDGDGDGRSHLQEYLAGTDPGSAASVFAMSSLLRDGGELVVEWKSRPGRGYAVEVSSNLADWSTAARVTASQVLSTTRIPFSADKEFVRIRAR